MEVGFGIHPGKSRKADDVAMEKGGTDRKFYSFRAP
jgi:hypothetical protein